MARQTDFRRNAGASVTLRPVSRFTVDLTATVVEMKHDNAPGTGYNEGNPYSQFGRMGRQVDTDSLRLHLRDASGKQISWNYSGHNNPYFATGERRPSVPHRAARDASGSVPFGR